MEISNKILNEALQLSPEQQAELVDQLLMKLNSPNAEIEEAWKKEIEQRIDLFDQDKINAISLEQVLSKYK